MNAPANIDDQAARAAFLTELRAGLEGPAHDRMFWRHRARARIIALEEDGETFGLVGYENAELEHLRALLVPSIQAIVLEVCVYFGLPWEEVTGRARTTYRYRGIACLLAKELTKLSYRQIGAPFRWRDHSSTFAAIEKVRAALPADDELAHDVDQIRRALRGEE